MGSTQSTWGEPNQTWTLQYLSSTLSPAAATMPMFEEIDLVNRDPNNINDHLKVQFEDVFAEPEGATPWTACGSARTAASTCARSGPTGSSPSSMASASPWSGAPSWVRWPSSTSGTSRRSSRCWRSTADVCRSCTVCACTAASTPAARRAVCFSTHSRNRELLLQRCPVLRAETFPFLHSCFPLQYLFLLLLSHG